MTINLGDDLDPAPAAVAPPEELASVLHQALQAQATRCSGAPFVGPAVRGAVQLAGLFDLEAVAADLIAAGWPARAVTFEPAIPGER